MVAAFLPGGDRAWTALRPVAGPNVMIVGTVGSWASVVMADEGITAHPGLADRGVRLAEAKQLIEKALEFAPSDPYIQDSLAWVEFRLGNRQEALRLIEIAYKAKPDAEIAAHFGEILWSLGQRERALMIWREGLQLNADNETLQETLKRLQVQP
jgi:tetratricopeptide (TPR) repeat protein